jgi:hypothetical protein
MASIHNYFNFTGTCKNQLAVLPFDYTDDWDKRIANICKILLRMYFLVGKKCEITNVGIILFIHNAVNIKNEGYWLYNITSFMR